MPLSDFLWTVQTPPQLSNGMKRKMSEDAPSFDLCDQNNKRRCTVLNAAGDACMDDENHNRMISQNLNNNPCHMTQGQQQLTCPGFLPPVPNHNPLSQSSNIPQNPGVITQPEQVSSCFQQLPLQHTGIVQQDDMIMNLNDEVYSNTTMTIWPTEEEMASNTMESDFVPDPQQYNSRFVEPQHLVVGESTASVDRVKCYCRPSWEGILEMKPYVSDYY